MAAKRSTGTKGRSAKARKRGKAKAPAANGEHVGEIQVQAAEETPQAPEVRLVEVVKADVNESGEGTTLPDEAVREAAAPDGEAEAEDAPEEDVVEVSVDEDAVAKAEAGSGDADEGAPDAPPDEEGDGGPEDVGPEGGPEGEEEEEQEAEPPAVGTLPGPAPAAPADEQLGDVMAHLLFHQALIRDADEGTNIKRYLELAQDFRQGVHVVLDNPFDKSIAIVFELVIEERMNPWDIDLRQFSSLYLDRVRDQSAVDFIAAGKLMFMAWSILKAQTDEVISAIQRIEAQRRAEEEAAQNPEAFDGAPFGDDAPWLAADETTYNFTRAVIEADPLELSEAVHPPSERPVTLYDLIHAFEEAKEESATRMILEEERAKARSELERTRKAKVSGMMHSENLEEEIAQTWMRILERVHKEESPATRLPLDSLHDGSRDDYLTVFVSSLFLAFNQRITLSQPEIPSGPIMIQLTPQAQKGDLPPMPAPVVFNPADAPPKAKAKRGKRRRKGKKPSKDN